MEWRRFQTTAKPGAEGCTMAGVMLGLSFLFLLPISRLNSVQYFAKSGAMSRLYFDSNDSISASLKVVGNAGKSGLASSIKLVEPL